MMRLRLAIAFVALLALTSSPTIQAQPMNDGGSMELVMTGYQLQGRLVNSTIYADDTIKMVMSVDDVEQTNIGQVTVTSSGNWYGRANGTSIEGIIYDVRGSVQVCYIFYCGNAAYVGYGTWAGVLTTSRSNAAGTFHGIIIFTNSQITGITLNKPVPISGTWNSTLRAVG